ncbi:MAG TPA: hypothetical protein VGH01_01605 [Jatrophihabitantaceae bacterium]
MPPPTVPPPSSASSSLDLSDERSAGGSVGIGPAAVTRSVARTRPRPTLQVAADDRVGAGQRRVLTRESPTATLTRLQSGVGTLIVDAAISAEVGDVTLGCAYELTTGETSTVQVVATGAGSTAGQPVGTSGAAPVGRPVGPAGSRRPVLVAGHDRFERVSVDLRQCRRLSRMVCFVHSRSRQAITWGGSLIVSTIGGTRVEVPLDGRTPGAVAVPLSIYQVDGELVLRCETQGVPGTVRDSCRAFGFDRISWLDDRTPID